MSTVVQQAGPNLVEPVKTVIDGVVREVVVPALVGPPPHGSLGDIPFDNAAQAPGEAVLARKGPDGAWRDVSAAEFAAEVLAVAKGLIAEGLRPGDRLAIMARTTYEWTLLDFAGWAAGLVTVPIYPTSSALQARWIIHDSGAVACAVEDTVQARIISGERGTCRGWPTCGSSTRAPWPGSSKPGNTSPTRWCTNAEEAAHPTTWPRSCTRPGPPGSPRAAY